MLALHLFKTARAKKATPIRDTSEADCFAYLKKMNDGIRRITEEEPNWHHAHLFDFSKSYEPIKTFNHEDLNR